MATNDKVAPLSKLTTDAKKNLDDMKAQLDAAEVDLNDLDELGFDTTRLRERLDWGRKAHSVLSKRTS
jgi:hypothetical protein